MTRKEKKRNNVMGFCGKKWKIEKHADKITLCDSFSLGKKSEKENNPCKIGGSESQDGGWLNLAPLNSIMSLEETSKLFTESQKIFNERDDVSINTPVMLNMLLRIVSSIDGRLKSIETSVESVKDIRNDLLLMSSQVRELETSVADIVKSQK
ncbi:unnamed protein product [Mytilus coruscus]|uniref:Uncharacterized protein n=1 Tax=Mytilus coruscus TaxID=42192 RepID=A0A6J8BEF2_MYTCO|nr:unnamed protein product [Mytilus coruscus]